MSLILLLIACQQPAPPPAPAPTPAPSLAPGLAFRDPVTATGLCEPSALAPDGAVLRALDDDRKKQVFSLSPGGGAASKARRRQGGEPYRLNDAEAVAVAGEARWWVTSHSRNKRGERDETRERLVRTDRSGLVVEATHTLAGLREALSTPLCPDCAVPTGFEALPSKAGGLDIEGLAVSGDGALMVGLRGPLTVDGRALVIALPPEGLDDTRVSGAWALDLGGRGIRSLERIPGEDTYILIAGPTARSGAFSLHRWTPGAPPVALGPIPLPAPGTAPEGLAIVSASPAQVDAFIAYDEGSRVEAAQAGSAEPLKCDDLLDGSPAQAALVYARLAALRWSR